jgi:hypothetical protein
MVLFLVVIGLATVGQLFRSLQPGSTATDSTVKSDSSAQSIIPNRTTLADLKLDFTWRKDAFDTIMMANFTIRNNGPQPVKDLEITCTHSASSGTGVVPFRETNS